MPLQSILQHIKTRRDQKFASSSVSSSRQRVRGKPVPISESMRIILSLTTGQRTGRVRDVTRLMPTAQPRYPINRPLPLDPTSAGAIHSETIISMEMTDPRNNAQLDDMSFGEEEDDEELRNHLLDVRIIMCSFQNHYCIVPRTLVTLSKESNILVLML